MYSEAAHDFILVTIVAGLLFALALAVMNPIANFRGRFKDVVPRQWFGLMVFALGSVAPTIIYGATYQSYWALVVLPITSFSLIVTFAWLRREYKNRQKKGWMSLSPDGPYFPVARDHLYPESKYKHHGRTPKN